MRSFLNKYAVWILIVISFVSRLPQICSEYFLMDGDECIVGLMAKHLYEGKELSFFFWGQSYGFAFFELIAIDVFYFFFGVSDLSVKLAMLSLWTTGILFFYKSLKQINEPDSLTPLLASLIFILAPAWAVWAMKARGGYLPAFVISNIYIYICIHQTKFKNAVSYGMIAALLMLVYQCQALWIPPLIPFLAYKIYRDRKFFLLIWFALSGVFMWTVFYVLKHNIVVFWPQPESGFTDDLLSSLKHMPGQVYQTMTGSYYLQNVIDLNTENDLLAMCFTVLIFLMPLLGIYFLIKRANMPFLYLGLVSTISCILSVLIMPQFAPRYLLPLFGFAMFTIAVAWKMIEHKKMIYFSFFILFFAMGSFSLYRFKDFRFEPQSGTTLRGLSDYLIRRNIKHVFCRGPLLQWQINFYSKEKLTVRYSAPVDRYQPYIDDVNKAYNAGKPTALVDFYNYQPFEAGINNVLVEGAYVVKTNLSHAELSENGFETR